MNFTPLALPAQSNPSRHGHAGAARLINCYSEDAGQEAKFPLQIHASDGFSLFSTVGSGPIRGMLALDDANLYVVSGRSVYLVNYSGTATLIGAVANDGFLTMARNRVSPNAQIAIVSGGLYYVIQANVMTKVEDPDLPPPISVCTQDGYFIFPLEDGRFFVSEIDGTGVDGLDTATAESNPDDNVRAWIRGSDLMIGGKKSLEAWQNSGGEFPYSRVTVVRTAEDDRDIGVLAPDAVDESIFVASDKTVRMLKGYQAVIVSHDAVHRAIAAETDPTTISAMSWQARGHTFYAISGTSFSWVLDLTTGRWHERQSYGLSRWRIAKAVKFGNRLIYGDYETGKLYTSSATDYDEAGTELVMTIQNAPVHGFPYRFRHNALRIDVVPGVGLVTATDYLANPKLMMRYSDDGGASWSTERSATMGAAGDGLREMRFNRLGMARSRTYRFDISAAVARSIIGVSAALDKLAA